MLKWIGWKCQQRDGAEKEKSSQHFSYANNSFSRFPFDENFRLTREYTHMICALCMLMEIVCFTREYGAKEDIGLNLHQSISHQTLHLCIESFEVKHGKSITCKLFSCRFMCARFKLGLSAKPANTNRSS